MFCVLLPKHRRKPHPCSFGVFCAGQGSTLRNISGAILVVPVASNQVLCKAPVHPESTWFVALKGQIATEIVVAVPQPQTVSRKTAIWPYLRPVYGLGKVPDGYPSDTREGVFVLSLFCGYFLRSRNKIAR